MKYHPPFGSTDPNASYVDKNVPGAVRGSPVPAAAVEAPQRELVDLIEKSGFTPDDTLQLALAVQSGRVNYAVASGSPNVIVTALLPAPSVLQDGLRIWLLPSSVNTAAVTLNVNGLGAVAIQDENGQALQAGDIQIRPTEMIYFSGAWRLINKPGGKLARIVTLATAGSGTYNPTPGTRRIIVRGQGGGGAGGGCPATGAGSVAAGGGGTCGAFGFKEIQNPVATSYSIGAAGVAVAGGNGGNGGNTTFGSMTLPGGGGGGVGVATSGASSNGPYTFGSAPTGVDHGSRGQAAGFGITVSATSAIGGCGGSSQYGSGGSYAGQNGTGVLNGVAAAGNGAGGGGGAAVGTGAVTIGGNGAPGILIIEEYT